MIVIAWLLATALPPAATRAAIPPDEATAAAIKRVLTLLNVTSGEYREGVVGGEIVLQVEYDEARAFAEEAEQRLRGALNADAEPFAGAFVALHAAIAAKGDSGEIRRQTDALRARITEHTGVSEDVYPAMPPSASRGRELFSSNCASCHGVSADGRGESAVGLDPPPADFTDDEFMNGVAPFDLFNIIAVGRSGSAMPSWEDVLSIQDRWDVVSYLWTVHPGADRLAAGQDVFHAHCAGCHGASADGRGASNAPLNTVETLAEKTDTDLFAAITDGLPQISGHEFAQQLSEEQRWAAVSFLRVLALGGDDGRQPAPTLDDADARQFAGILRLLAAEYGKAVGSGSVSEVDYRESAILVDLIEQRRERALATLARYAPDRSDEVRRAVDEIGDIVSTRGAVKDLTARTGHAAHLIDTTVPAVVTANAADALNETRRLLNEALLAYRVGESNATYLVSDAYFQFEPFEAKLNAVDAGLRARIENRFLELRGLLGTPGAQPQAAAVVEAIVADLEQARAVTDASTGAYATFTQSAMIILREGFEVVLVVGALLAYVAKSSTPQLRTSILAGTGVGVLVSLASAYALSMLLRSTIVVSEAIEGFTLLLASVVLFSVSYWLVSKAEAEKWQRYIQGKVKSAISRGSRIALAGAAFLAVFREGIETVLFYRALLAGADAHRGPAVAGFAAGCVALAIVYVLSQRFGKRLPLRQFFLITGALLYYLSFVFAGRGVAALQQIGWLSTTLVPGLPVIDLIGFHPTIETLIAQGVLFVCLVYALIVTWRDRPPAATKLDTRAA